MSEQALEQIEVEKGEKGFVVSSPEQIKVLEERGYGDRLDSGLLLKNYEALFLIHAGKLVLKTSRSAPAMERLVRRSLKEDPVAWTKFLVYRDLRSRGYVVREGFGFGADFRVYERGEYGNRQARYVVFGMNEGTEIDTKAVKERVEQIMKMGKEPIVAVIERRGEVVYYRLSKVRFGK